MKLIIYKTIYIIAGLTILASIFFQIYSLATSDNLELVNFLSLFTIQSNILAGVVFILAGVTSRPVIDKLRGVATLALVVTSLGFIVLLGGEQDYLVPLVNLIVHYLAPVFAIISWLLDPPATRLSFLRSLTWLLYPLLYFIYTMVRGFVTNWYPYDFIDPNQVGIEGVAYNFGIILLGSVVCMWLLNIRGSQTK